MNAQTGQGHQRPVDTRMMAMKEADRQGHPEVVLRLLRGTVRPYARTARSKHGVQIADWDKAVPDGTEAVVIVDTYDGKPSFFIIPVKAYGEMVRASGPASPGRMTGAERPVTPGSRHCYITPAQVVEYRNTWQYAA
jgi:hypothetical protein